VRARSNDLLISKFQVKCDGSHLTLIIDINHNSTTTTYIYTSVSDGDMSDDMQNPMSVLICHFKAS
jgi:hypothetical protein